MLRDARGLVNRKRVEYLRIAIRDLRQKLEVDPSQPNLIVNELAVGYRLRT